MENLIEEITFKLSLKHLQGNIWEVERNHLCKRAMPDHNMLKKIEFIKKRDKHQLKKSYLEVETLFWSYRDGAYWEKRIYQILRESKSLGKLSVF